MNIALIFWGVFFIIVMLYFFIIRPIHLRWGATIEEVKSKMPGDEIVKTVHFNATRAISINSPPPKIFGSG